MTINIVSFRRGQYVIEIGFRLGIAVVYASVPINLSDDLAKQKGYEQVRKALEYEQTRDIPSFTVSNEVDEEGNVIPFEVFTPAEPVVKSIAIHGERHIAFTDDSPSKTVEFVAMAIDQYGDPIDTSFAWTCADNGVLTVDNADSTYEVTVAAGGATTSITVTVQGYVAPQPEIDYEKLALFEAVAGLEDRMSKVEGGLE